MKLWTEWTGRTEWTTSAAARLLESQARPFGSNLASFVSPLRGSNVVLHLFSQALSHRAQHRRTPRLPAWATLGHASSVYQCAFLKSSMETSQARRTSSTVAGASIRNSPLRLRSSREALTASFTAKKTLFESTSGGSPTSFDENSSLGSSGTWGYCGGRDARSSPAEW